MSQSCQVRLNVYNNQIDINLKDENEIKLKSIEIEKFVKKIVSRKKNKMLKDKLNVIFL